MHVILYTSVVALVIQQARSAHNTEHKAHTTISRTYNEREKEKYNTVQARSSYDTERKAHTTISGTYSEKEDEVRHTGDRPRSARRGRGTPYRRQTTQREKRSRYVVPAADNRAGEHEARATPTDHVGLIKRLQATDHVARVTIPSLGNTERAALEEESRRKRVDNPTRKKPVLPCIPKNSVSVSQIKYIYIHSA